MKTVSVRDLHLRTSAILKEVEKGKVFVVEKRGVAVAEVRPVQRGWSPEELRKMRVVWAKAPSVKTDSGRFLEKHR